MKRSRRSFLKTATASSLLLGTGGVLSGALVTGCSKGLYPQKSADGSSPYYDREITTICKADKHFPRHSEASIIELKDSSLLLAWMRFEESPFGSGDRAPSNIA
ncbi:MAG: twin-arginine translocation signal domain-containing protein, partial [Bacteroidales bacterium]|nr:twin-arginine translocation signal domain-containing protein [Bacteroidales bacterium]